MKICKQCTKIKQLTEFYTAGTYKGKTQYRGICINCIKINPKPEKYKEQIKTYKSTDEYKEKRKSWRCQPHIQAKERAYEKKTATHRATLRRIRDKNKYDNNPMFKLKHLLRKRTSEMLKASRWHKTNTFKQYIGCTIEELKSHIEKQFISGMTWQNHGEWEIDHVIPLSSAKNSNELYKLSHFTNLQPLWWQDNNKKSDNFK